MGKILNFTQNRKNRKISVQNKCRSSDSGVRFATGFTSHMQIAVCLELVLGLKCEEALIALRECDRFLCLSLGGMTRLYHELDG